MCEGGKVSLYLFSVIILYRVFINRDLKKGNGRSGSMGVIPLIISPAPVSPGSETVVLRIDCLNVRCCNEVEKRDEIGSMFEDCKLDILGLSEIKLREEEELNFGGVGGFRFGVGRRGKARDGVVVLMNKRVWMCVREIRRIN